MKRSLIQSVLIAAALLLPFASLSIADEGKSAAVGEVTGVGGAKTSARSAKTKSAKAAKKVKLVDINSANKAQLKKLPGIGDAQADKIIAGRPYLSKAHLLTHNVLSREQYEEVRGLVIARQNAATAAKLKELENKGH